MKNADDAGELGIGTIRLRLERRPKAFTPPAQNLADLFADSPFAGLDMDFKRDADVGREVSL